MRNKLEQKVATELGGEFEYEAVRLPYVIAHNYLPDFTNEKTKEIVEVKGHFPASDRAKMLAVCKAHPDWSIMMVFQDPTKTINKKSKTTYSAWCDKHGIAWRKA